LGRLLNRAGYTAWPASNSADANFLLTEWNGKLDLLIINRHLTGAAELIENLRRRRPFKTIAVQAEGEEPWAIAGIDEVLRKPHPIDRLSGFEWILAVERVLDSKVGG